MTKSEAQKKLQAGEIQIHFDDKSKLDLLKELFNDNRITGSSKYYFDGKHKAFTYNNDTGFNVPIIKISEITEDEEEVIWNYSDIQFKYKNEDWQDVTNHNMKYRLKPKPDFSKEIEALQQKAKENGMKAVITLEKI